MNQSADYLAGVRDALDAIVARDVGAETAMHAYWSEREDHNNHALAIQNSLRHAADSARRHLGVTDRPVYGYFAKVGRRAERLVCNHRCDTTTALLAAHAIESAKGDMLRRRAPGGHHRGSHIGSPLVRPCFGPEPGRLP